ncbi:hypothetical protein [Algicola sagamiensis]|uniref:hypothetical protein n=1 Tax=Algicola sagamiensis TaxID=163869 RepID=UPI000364D29F|nr:hypothetical protein [Algicola sagamiensis]
MDATFIGFTTIVGQSLYTVISVILLWVAFAFFSPSDQAKYIPCLAAVACNYVFTSLQEALFLMVQGSMVFYDMAAILTGLMAISSLYFFKALQKRQIHTWFDGLFYGLQWLSISLVLILHVNSIYLERYFTSLLPMYNFLVYVMNILLMLAAIFVVCGGVTNRKEMSQGAAVYHEI